MKLGQAEAFGAVDEHDRRVRDVDANFDDTRRDQELYLPFLEGFHDGFFLFAGHAAVDEAAWPLGKDLGPQLFIEFRRRLQVDRLRRFDEGTDDVTLLALGHELVHEDIDPPAQGFADGIGLDPFPARRHLADGRHVQVTIEGQGQRPGNGRGRHEQGVRLFSLMFQG